MAILSSTGDQASLVRARYSVLENSGLDARLSEEAM
jgi:hypothetical protein